MRDDQYASVRRSPTSMSLFECRIKEGMARHSFKHILVRLFDACQSMYAYSCVDFPFNYKYSRDAVRDLTRHALCSPFRVECSSSSIEYVTVVVRNGICLSVSDHELCGSLRGRRRRLRRVYTIAHRLSFHT